MYLMKKNKSRCRQELNGQMLTATVFINVPNISNSNPTQQMKRQTRANKLHGMLLSNQTDLAIDNSQQVDTLKSCGGKNIKLGKSLGMFSNY